VRTITVKELLSAVGGTLLAGSMETKIASVSTDSRTAGEGALFVPLAGERFDGHDYIGKALAAGAESAALEAGRPELEQDDAGRKASAKKETPTASAAGQTTAEKEAEGDMESGTIPENEGEEDGRKAGGRDRGGRIRAKKEMKPEADDGPQEGVQSADSVTE